MLWVVSTECRDRMMMTHWNFRLLRLNYYGCLSLWVFTGRLRRSPSLHSNQPTSWRMTIIIVIYEVPRLFGIQWPHPQVDGRTTLLGGFGCLHRTLMAKDVTGTDTFRRTGDERWEMKSLFLLTRSWSGGGGGGKSEKKRSHEQIE